MNTIQEQLRTIFSASGWKRFIETLRDYRDNGRTLPASVALKNASDEERRHLARLLRLTSPSLAGSLRYDLGKIESALQARDLWISWEELLTLICGTIPENKLAAHASKLSWQRFWPQMMEVLHQAPFPHSLAWGKVLSQDGLLKRLSKGDATLASNWLHMACRLLRALPLPEDAPLASVGAKYCGDSHALDANTPLSTIVLKGLALRHGASMPVRADERRELWAAFRVICDELSAPVLTLNLGVTGDALLCQLTARAAENNQPLHLTSRLLWTVEWEKIICPPIVYVCENPTIVSIAANSLGRKCPPLVCVDGEPKTASRVLLRRLKKGGSQLRYHGDFDWAGIAIATRVFQEFDAIPWCYDVEDYLIANLQQGRTLIGKPIPTPWSPMLSEVMQQNGVAYDEELLADKLLIDFA